MENEKKRLKTKIHRKSVSCNKILNNLMYVSLKSHIIIQVIWLVSWGLFALKLFLLRWPISGLHDLSFASGIAQACSKMEQTQENEQKCAISLNGFGPRSVSYQLCYFFPKQGQPGFNEVGKWTPAFDDSTLQEMLEQ